MELPGGEHYLAFFVFHFRFGRKKTKNLNRKRFKIPQNSEFRIWNLLEFLGFCFFKNFKFLLVVHQIPIDPK
jgi:hypothetical protein